MDNRTKEQRSHNMSMIRSIKTKPELMLKRIMKLLGFSYQPKGIIGKPDFANKKYKIAIFIDGCFWHRCPKHYIKPKTNIIFWKDKIRKNVKRDGAITKKLEKEGWKVIRIWEHDLKLLRSDLRKY